MAVNPLGQPVAGPPPLPPAPRGGSMPGTPRPSAGSGLGPDWNRGERGAAMNTAHGKPRIVVGVDESPASLAALRWAAREAGLRATRLQVVQAWERARWRVAPYASCVRLRGPDEDHAELRAYLRVLGVEPEDVITSRFLPRMVVAGALPLAAAGGLAGRPAVTASGVTGVYLAGDWVGPRGWLSDASLASGRAAAVAALSRPRGSNWFPSGAPEGADRMPAPGAARG